MHMHHFTTHMTLSWPSIVFLVSGETDFRWSDEECYMTGKIMQSSQRAVLCFILLFTFSCVYLFNNILIVLTLFYLLLGLKSSQFFYFLYITPHRHYTVCRHCSNNYGRFIVISFGFAFFFIFIGIYYFIFIISVKIRK